MITAIVGECSFQSSINCRFLSYIYILILIFLITVDVRASLRAT